MTDLIYFNCSLDSNKYRKAFDVRLVIKSDLNTIIDNRLVLDDFEDMSVGYMSEDNSLPYKIWARTVDLNIVQIFECSKPIENERLVLLYKKVIPACLNRHRKPETIYRYEVKGKTL